MNVNNFLIEKEYNEFVSLLKIYINSKIMELEESCIKYIVIHELCHLKYKTHAKSFYNLVKKYFPKYEKYDEILNGYKF